MCWWCCTVPDTNSLVWTSPGLSQDSAAQHYHIISGIRKAGTLLQGNAPWFKKTTASFHSQQVTFKRLFIKKYWLYHFQLYEINHVKCELISLFWQKTSCSNAGFEPDLFSGPLPGALTMSAVCEHCCIFFVFASSLSTAVHDFNLSVPKKLNI